MVGYRALSLVIVLTLLLPSLPRPVRAYTLPNVEPALPDTTPPETVRGVPGATTGWWFAVQEDIRQSEYHVTWQERTCLESLGAAYQAPNRAHNLRTTFTPQSIRVIPRVFEGETPPWEWGLTLSGYGYADDVRPVAAATLQADANRIKYERDALTEWYVNDERGLEQGFTLTSPPAPSPQAGRGWPRRGRGWGKDNLTLDLALSGNLTPNLADDGSAIEFTTPGGVRVLRYSDLYAYDATGRPLPAQMRLTTNHVSRFTFHESRFAFHVSPNTQSAIRITIDDTHAVYPITIDPLATSPAWTAESDQDDAHFGHSVETAGDVNGDGYSDVIVGAPWYDNGEGSEGQAYVYHGAPTGLPTAADWTAESDQTGASFGFSVGTAGDVDGDGYSDVVIGAPYYNNGQVDKGRATVYHGSATGLSATPAWTAESDYDEALFGFSVGTAGDVTGDGYSDVIVGAPGHGGGTPSSGQAFVYYGSASGLSAFPAWFAGGIQRPAGVGCSVGTAGDVNGDGYSDIIVGAYYFIPPFTLEGRAYVYHGRATGLLSTADWIAESNQAYAELGFPVGTAGDVNGDGYSDVIVGAPSEGQAYVYHGSAAGLSATADRTVESDQAGANFGASVGTAGDVDGDGYSDVIVGAPDYDNEQTDEGRAYLYHGSATGLSTAPAWTAESDQDDAEFGFSVGTAGDVNGDGYSDVIVGATDYDNEQTDEGRTYVYHGAAAGLSTASAWTAESDQANAYLGWSVGAAGDVNGDGYSDVIVGVPDYDNGQTDEGRAYVYLGSTTGLSTTLAWTVESDQAYAYLGFSAGTAGDVNGDGYSDVIVGAYFYDNGEADEGQATVYHGSATGLSATPAWTAESDQAGAYFGFSVGTAGDVNGDGYSDVVVGAPSYTNDQTDEGRANVYHGAQTGLSTAPAWVAESDQAGASFGISVGTAGDVNGDGYSDVIVGAHYYDNGQTNEGRAYAYHGTPTGLSTTPAWTAESDQPSAYFGIAVGTAGDVNGDGRSDVIVGAHCYDNGQTDEGRAYAYHGTPTGLSAAPAWTAESDQDNAKLGASVGTAGDVNGDGYSDVVVGVPDYDSGEANEGRAHVYHGAPTGLSTTPAWTAESDQDDACLGFSVGTAGDVNGDGYSDVIVGAHYYDNGQTDEGRAFLYYGNGGDGLHLLPRQVRSDGSGPIAHLGLSDSQTNFELRLVGRMPLGREDVRLQWQVAPLGTPITATSVISGVSGWTDVLTTGVEITQTVSGLMPGTPHHWRVRLLYRPGNALGQPAGRWVHIPWNGWNEADLRMAPGPNQPPVSDAGTNQSVSTLALVTLDGSGSSDPDGDLPLTYYWTQTGGPAVTLSNPAVVMPTFTAPPDPAVLTFTLAVTDSLGLPDPTPDEAVVTVVGYDIYLPLVVRQDGSVAAQDVHTRQEKPAGCPTEDCHPSLGPATLRPNAFDDFPDLYPDACHGRTIRPFKLVASDIPWILSSQHNPAQFTRSSRVFHALGCYNDVV